MHRIAEQTFSGDASQEWAKFAKSKTARHKLAKFLKDNARLLPDHLKAESPLGLMDGPGSESDAEEQLAPRIAWLDVEGEEGPSLLAELAQIIAKHGHDVKVCINLVSIAYKSS